MLSISCCGIAKKEIKNMTIGNRIVQLRKQLLLSQEDIADQIGVSRQSISKWETDACAPDAYNLIALAKVLNTSVEYIVSGSSSAETKETFIQNANPRVMRSNMAILGFILLAGGFIMAFIGMFLEAVWCIIGGGLALLGIIFALVQKKKTLYIALAILAVLIIAVVLLLTI